LTVGVVPFQLGFQLTISCGPDGCPCIVYVCIALRSWVGLDAVAR